MGNMTEAYRREIVHPADVESVHDGFGPRWTNTVEVSLHRVHADEEIQLRVGGGFYSAGSAALTIESAEAVIEALAEAVMLAKTHATQICNVFRHRESREKSSRDSVFHDTILVSVQSTREVPQCPLPPSPRPGPSEA